MSDIQGARIVEPTQDHLDWCRRVNMRPPHALMMVDVTLMRTSDGEVRTYVDTCGYRIETAGDEDETISHVRFMWHEGNYSCDCNRARMFCDDPDDIAGDITCSHGKYRIIAPPWLVNETEKDV